MSEYFSHDYDARDDDKIQRLIYDLGWEGYGLYWALIETLYKNDGYLTYEYERIAYTLRAQGEYIVKIINDYGLFEIKGGNFFSQSVLNRLELRKTKSDNARRSVKARWDKQLDTNVSQDPYDSNTIKKSKVKDNKDKEEGFGDFWDNYHMITGKLKTDKDDAFKYWIKLIKKEKELALENIKPYCDSQRDKEYCKKARTYLSDKSFNDEFIGPKIKKAYQRTIPNEYE